MCIAKIFVMEANKGDTEKAMQKATSLEGQQIFVHSYNLLAVSWSLGALKNDSVSEKHSCKAEISKREQIFVYCK